MRRVLVFPPLFAAWFGVGQFGLIVLNRLSFYLTLRLISSSLRVRFHVLAAVEFSLPYVLRAGIVGACVGVMLALLDFALHREDSKFEETLLRLLGHLLKGGAVAVALVLLYYGIFGIPIQLQLSRTPRAVYTPYRTISWWGNFAPSLLLLFSVLWAMRKTLQRQT